METRKKRLLIASTIVIMGLLAFYLVSPIAYGHPRFGWGGSWGMQGGEGGLPMAWIGKHLNLTDEQKSQMQAIRETHKDKFRELWKQMRTVRTEMVEKFFNPGELNEADLQPYLEQLATFREQLIQESLKMFLEVRALLTPEQLAKAAELKDRMRSLREEMHSLFHKED